jgi:hypothetical protein
MEKRQKEERWRLEIKEKKITILKEEKLKTKILFLCFFKENVKITMEKFYEFTMKNLFDDSNIQPEFKTFHKFCWDITPRRLLKGYKPFLKACNYVLNNPQVLVETEDYKYVFIHYPDERKCKDLVEILKIRFNVLRFNFKNFDNIMEKVFLNYQGIIQGMQSRSNGNNNVKYNINSNNDIIHVTQIIESQKFWSLLEEEKVFFEKVPNRNIFDHFLSYFKDPNVYFYFEEISNLFDMKDTAKNNNNYFKNLKYEGKKICKLIQRALLGKENEYSGVAVKLKEKLGNVKEIEKDVRDHPIYGKIDVLFESAILEIKYVGEIQKKDFVQPLIYRELLLSGNEIFVYVFNARNGVLYKVIEENVPELKKRLKNVLKRFVRE